MTTAAAPTRPREITAPENAQHSTGPTSAAGKAVSSMNALKHGARATRVLLPGEDPAEFEALRQALLEHHAPQTDTERQLLESLAALYWKSRRLDRLEWEFWTRATRPRPDGSLSETPLADAFCTHHKELALLLRYQSQTHRQLDKTEKELRETIKTRKMAAAMTARWADRAALPTSANDAQPADDPLALLAAALDAPPPGAAPTPALTPTPALPRPPARRNSQFLPNRGRR